MNTPDRSLFRFLRISAGVGVLRAMGLMAVLLLHVLIARLLSDTQAYGQYAWLSSLLFLLGGLLGFGAPLMATRVLARDRALPGDPQFTRVQAWAERRVLAGGLATVLVAGTALVASYSVRGEFSLTWWVVMASPLVAILALQQGLGQATKHLFWAFAPQVLLRPLLTLLAVGGLWYLAPGYFGVPAIVAIVVAVLALLVLLQRSQLGLGGVRGRPAQRVEGGLRRELRKGSAFFYLQRVANVAGEHGYTVVVGLLVAPEAAALYFAAERLARLVTVPQQFNSWFLQPEFAASGGNGHGYQLQQLTAQASAVSLASGLLVALALGMSSYLLLGLFGKDFAAARPLLLVLVGGHLADLACGPVRDLLAMRAREHNLALLSVASLVIQFAAVALLVPAHGALGAAWATAITLLLVNGLGLVLVRRSLGLASGLPSLVHLGRNA